MAYLALLFVLAGMISGTLSFQAYDALPGDALYPYKVTVNERTQELLAFSDTEKAKQHIHMVEKRLEEARELAQQRKLTAQAQVTINNAVTQHLKNTIEVFENLESSNKRSEAAELAVLLHSTLSAQSALLTDISSQGSIAMQVSLAPIQTHVRTTLASVARISTKLQARASGVVPDQNGTLTKR